MRRSYNKRSILSLIILTLLLAVVIPATALGQGRGRGHGRGGIFGNPNNKCGKFVNCHDARNGRWDGRGPRRNRVGNSIVYTRMRRNRNIDTDRYVIRNRRVSRDRTNSWRNRGRRIQRHGNEQ
jgi:hypothetical protein